VQLHTQGGEGTDDDNILGTGDSEGLKYIQDSLYLHIRYSMIRVKHVEGERQRMKEK